MQAVSDMLTRWQELRAELVEMERAEHPDIVDRHGRTWTWRGRGDLYRHCGTAAPVDMIGQFGLPTQRALDNPNYDLCAICLDGRKRNVPDCKPEWNCSHTMHKIDAPAECGPQEIGLVGCGGTAYLYCLSPAGHDGKHTP